MKAINLLFMLLLAGHSYGQQVLDIPLSATQVAGKANIPLSTSASSDVTKKAISIKIVIPYTYALSIDSRTSAGIFLADTLVRTLWNNRAELAGTKTSQYLWDGKNDDGNEVANGNYTLRVVANNISYTWEGVIGNTSTNTSGVIRHNWTDRIVDLCIAGDKAYFTCGYLEGAATEKYFNLATPNIASDVFSGTGRSTGFIGQAVASDGVRVYYTGYDPNLPTESGVFAFNVSDNSAYTFSAGASYTLFVGGVSYPSVIDRYNSYQTLTYASSVAIPYNYAKPNTKLAITGNVTLSVSGSSNGDIGFVALTKSAGTETVTVTGTSIGNLGILATANSISYINWTNNAGTIEWRDGRGGSGANYLSNISSTAAKKPTGLAVQKTGNYLFVSRKNLNQIDVLNKTTGALVQEVAITKPERMAVNESNLWVVTNGSVAKYTVNSDGTLTSPVLSLSGLVKPLALGLSTSNDTLLVVDGGSSSQVKAFNASTGASLWTYGQAGGYASSPDVADDKFVFKNTKLIYYYNLYAAEDASFIASKTDGSFWLGDMGNQRALLINNTRTAKLDEIFCLGYHYSASVDRNNPTRAFTNWLEWEIDYSKPLQVGNGSWKLKRNWSNNVVSTYDDQFYRIRYPHTLSNGRTYAMVRTSIPSDRLEIIELTTSGLRYTGVQTTDLKWGMESNGDLVNVSNTTIGQQALWRRRVLTGFDGNNNPQYAAFVTIASIASVNLLDPLSNSGNVYGDIITSNGTIVVYSEETPSTQGLRGSGYHLAGLPVGAINYKFRTSKATRKDYVGEYPDDAAYDIGNGVIYGGSFGTSIDNLILTGFRGENWKQSQTNKWNLFSDNGLMLGQFGITEPDAKLIVARAAPGSAGNANTGTIVKVGSNYYLYHCDETHHSAMHRWKISNTSSIQSFTFVAPKTGPLFVTPLPGIDLMADLPASGVLTNGTSRWTRNPATESTTPIWSVATGKTTYRTNDRDLFIWSVLGVNTLNCDLGIASSVSGWKITGLVGYPAKSDAGPNYLQVLDVNGKIIAQISRSSVNPNIIVKANTTTLVSDLADVAHELVKKPMPFTIQVSGGSVIIKLGNFTTVVTGVFEAGADITRPATLQTYFNSATTAVHQQVVQNARLAIDP